jgi:hypothetical protein
VLPELVELPPQATTPMVTMAAKLARHLLLNLICASSCTESK